MNSILSQDRKTRDGYENTEEQKRNLERKAQKKLRSTLRNSKAKLTRFGEKNREEKFNEPNRRERHENRLTHAKAGERVKRKRKRNAQKDTTR